jgi:hypothetical protein
VAPVRQCVTKTDFLHKRFSSGAILDSTHCVASPGVITKNLDRFRKNPNNSHNYPSD